MPHNTFTIRNATVLLGGKPIGQADVESEIQINTPGLYLQQAGRALRGRLVHAQRARKLRRRGEDVRYVGRTSTGLAKYRWFKKAITIEFVAGMGKTRRAIDPLPRSAAECEFGDEEYQWRLRQ